MEERMTDGWWKWS